MRTSNSTSSLCRVYKSVPERIRCADLPSSLKIPTPSFRLQWGAQRPPGHTSPRCSPSHLSELPQSLWSRRPFLDQPKRNKHTKCKSGRREALPSNLHASCRSPSGTQLQQLSLSQTSRRSLQSQAVGSGRQVCTANWNSLTARIQFSLIWKIQTARKLT